MSTKLTIKQINQISFYIWFFNRNWPYWIMCFEAKTKVLSDRELNALQFCFREMKCAMRQPIWICQHLLSTLLHEFDFYLKEVFIEQAKTRCNHFRAKYILINIHTMLCRYVLSKNDQRLQFACRANARPIPFSIQ